MRKLPKGWEWKRLGEICLRKAQYGSGAKKVDFNEKIRYVRITDIEENGSLKSDGLVSPSIPEEDCFLELNDLLFARSGSVGRTYLHSKNDLTYQFAGYLIRFRINPNIADAKYVFYVTKSKYYLGWVESLKRNVTISNINAVEFSSFEVPLPPLPIQKRIVAVLERAERLKEKRAQANEEANKIIQSIFYKMFGDLSHYESSGNIKKLGEVFLFVRGPFGGSLKKEIFKDQGYAVYEQQHAIGDNFSEIRYFITDEKFNEMKRFELNSGDLIMSCSGTMGKIAIVPPGIKRGIINQALLKLTPNKDLSRVFLKHWLESKSFQNSLKVFSQGAAIQNVASVKILKDIKIPLPPMDVQNQFASIVEKIESLNQKQSTSTSDINTLFHALMQKAFSGELVS